MHIKLDHIKWIGCWVSIFSAIILSLNISNVSEWAFIGYAVGSVLWVYIAIKMKEKSLIYMNLTYTGINIVAIVRWIIIPHFL